MEIRIKQGDRASLSKTFTEREVLLFSELSEDRNPIHIDVAAGEASIFGAQVVHGMLVASLISGLLGLHLPGPGSIYLGQELKFTAPVFIGDEITAVVEVTALREDKPIATLRTYCVNQANKVVIDGVATVKLA